jgi:hypothetical protein
MLADLEDELLSLHRDTGKLSNANTRPNHLLFQATPFVVDDALIQDPSPSHDQYSMHIVVLYNSN